MPGNIDALLSGWAVELHAVGTGATRRWKLLMARKEYAPCFVGYGPTVQAAVDDAMRSVEAHVASLEPGGV